jgi:hypothetical protein
LTKTLCRTADHPAFLIQKTEAGDAKGRRRHRRRNREKADFVGQGCFALDPLQVERGWPSFRQMKAEEFGIQVGKQVFERRIFYMSGRFSAMRRK